MITLGGFNFTLRCGFSLGEAIFLLSRPHLLQAINFINILDANFTYKSLYSSFSYLHVTREQLP
jgi:hypothetical protein